MDYESIFESQLSKLDLSGFQEILDSPLIPSEISGSISIKDILLNMLTGKELISWERLFDIIKILVIGEMKDIMVLSAELICICVVSGLLGSMTSSFGQNTVSGVASSISSFMAAGMSIAAFYQVYLLCIDAVSTMTKLMGVSLPLIFALTAASGAAVSSTVMNSVITGAVTIFSAIVSKFLMPAVFVSCIMTIVNSLGSRSYIKKMSQLLRSGALFVMGFLISIFTGLSSIQGIMTKSADGMLIKTARYSLDNFVPFIGSFTADSLEMIINCVKSVRNGLGIAAVIILVLLLAGPLIKTLAIVLVFKLSAVILEPMGNDRVSECMNDIGKSAVILMTLLLLVSMMFIIFFAAIIKTGGS